MMEIKKKYVTISIMGDGSLLLTEAVRPIAGDKDMGYADKAS